MFEKYNENARRVVFFARHEAGIIGGHAIEPEHILLALFRENEELFEHFFSSPHAAFDDIRNEITRNAIVGKKVAASVDMPLSPGAKRVLWQAANVSHRMDHRHIGPEHLLLALLKEDSLASESLKRHGLSVGRVFAFVSGESETSPYQFASPTADQSIQAMFIALLDLLVRKGVIGEDNRQEILSKGRLP